MAGACVLGPDRKCLLQELPGGLSGEGFGSGGGWFPLSHPRWGSGRGFLDYAENQSETR